MFQVFQMKPVLILELVILASMGSVVALVIGLAPDKVNEGLVSLCDKGAVVATDKRTGAAVQQTEDTTFEITDEEAFLRGDLVDAVTLESDSSPPPSESEIYYITFLTAAAGYKEVPCGYVVLNEILGLVYLFALQDLGASPVAVDFGPLETPFVLFEADEDGQSGKVVLETLEKQMYREVAEGNINPTEEAGVDPLDCAFDLVPCTGCRKQIAFKVVDNALQVRPCFLVYLFANYPSPFPNFEFIPIDQSLLTFELPDDLPDLEAKIAETNTRVQRILIQWIDDDMIAYLISFNGEITWVSQASSESRAWVKVFENNGPFLMPDFNGAYTVQLWSSNADATGTG